MTTFVFISYLNSVYRAFLFNRSHTIRCFLLTLLKILPHTLVIIVLLYSAFKLFFHLSFYKFLFIGTSNLSFYPLLHFYNLSNLFHSYFTDFYLFISPSFFTTTPLTLLYIPILFLTNSPLVHSLFSTLIPLTEYTI